VSPRTYTVSGTYQGGRENVEFAHSSHMQLWPNPTYQRSPHNPLQFTGRPITSTLSSARPLKSYSLALKILQRRGFSWAPSHMQDGSNFYRAGLSYLVGARPGSIRVGNPGTPVFVDSASPHFLPASPSNFTTRNNIIPLRKALSHLGTGKPLWVTLFR